MANALLCSEDNHQRLQNMHRYCLILDKTEVFNLNTLAQRQIEQLLTSKGDESAFQYCRSLTRQLW